MLPLVSDVGNILTSAQPLLPIPKVQPPQRQGTRPHIPKQARHLVALQIFIPYLAKHHLARLPRLLVQQAKVMRVQFYVFRFPLDPLYYIL